ncbi:uncharacterized protein LOC106013041 [Aplysia californica]|uniref:Uncharacterized protein LOC106013041 n=1 Tax=Aplysia californica TaxID=6500 RepID=A0ABM1A950_APLCA|nr:uncharacterized protein LOC106013041 [Aplysia californica]
MYTSNQEKLETIMEKPVQRMTDWASERKLKQFFQACNDLYTREQLRGKPFLEKIVANVGGWDGIGTFNESTWDMNWALKKVQTDFWVDALYAPRIGVSWQDSSRRDIQLTPAGTGKWMYWSWYTHPYAEYMRQDYKKFIRRVGSLLQRDANLASMTDEEKGRRLDQFVNDTFTIEYNVASIARQSQFSYNHYLEANKVSLADLNTETNNVINWVDQLSYMFNAAGVNANTRVVLLQRDYYRNITGMITSLPDEDRKRMMSNYFIWRMAEIYVQVSSKRQCTTAGALTPPPSALWVLSLGNTYTTLSMSGANITIR